ncbi:hypothetical protein Ancab_014025 [Ancistrocladus abbreviatus]
MVAPEDHGPSSYEGGHPGHDGPLGHEDSRAHSASHGGHGGHYDRGGGDRHGHGRPSHDKEHHDSRQAGTEFANFLIVSHDREIAVKRLLNLLSYWFPKLSEKQESEQTH